MESDWHGVHERVVATFATGWREFDRRSFDDLLAEDVRLVQPLLPACVGKRQWSREVERLSALLPDLRSEVLTWSGVGTTIFIEHRFTATVGNRSVAVPAVDKLIITDSGVVVHRTAFFDPEPFVRAILRRPSMWLRWWRSGLGPLLGRRRFLKR